VAGWWFRTVQRRPKNDLGRDGPATPTSVCLETPSWPAPANGLGTPSRNAGPALPPGSPCLSMSPRARPGAHPPARRPRPPLKRPTAPLGRQPGHPRNRGGGGRPRPPGVRGPSPARPRRHLASWIWAVAVGLEPRSHRRGKTDELGGRCNRRGPPPPRPAAAQWANVPMPGVRRHLGMPSCRGQPACGATWDRSPAVAPAPRPARDSPRLALTDPASPLHAMWL